MARLTGRRSRTRFPGHRPSRAAWTAPALVLDRLRRNPSLRHNEQGRRLLPLLQNNAVRTEEWSFILVAIPPHRSIMVAQLARQYAQMRLGFFLTVRLPFRMNNGRRSWNSRI